MIRLLAGDCREVLKALPNESVHCVVTSPPYFGLRDYGVPGQIGLEQSPQEYVEQLVAVFKEVRRVLRDDGTVWLNLGDSYAVQRGGTNMPPQTVHNGGGPYDFEKNRHTNRQAHRDASGIGLKHKDLIGIPWRVAFALQADGWWLRQDIIWAKPNPMPESVTDRCTKAHEYMFLMSKQARYYYDAAAIAERPVTAIDGRGSTAERKALGHPPRYGDTDSRAYRGKGWTMPSISAPEAGRNKRSVWEVATQPYSGAHFATFPPALIEPCIKAGTSEKGCCAKCGVPWVRQTERAPSDWQERKANGEPMRHGIASAAACGAGGFAGLDAKTVGWSPSCQCNADVVPCTVLDCFGGAGTTGLVADRLGRNAILIELNPEYAKMAERRIKTDAGMFAQVSA